MKMINKDFLDFTVSDLIIKCIYENNDLYIEEVKKRLYYCGFSPNVIDEVMKGELKLVHNKENKLISEKRIINDDFQIDNINVKNMMLGELLSLIDEAVMINKFFSDKYSPRVLKEIELISKENMHNIFFKAFYNRLEKCFRKANNLELKFKGFVYEEQIGKLYENEMQILLRNRWGSILELDYEPYSGDIS